MYQHARRYYPYADIIIHTFDVLNPIFGFGVRQVAKVPRQQHITITYDGAGNM